MRTTAFVHMVFGLLILLLFSDPFTSPAQIEGYPEPGETFSREELAQMLAPIALYPDVLLSQILMASTYPIEVIEADRWLRLNSELTGADLDAALLDKDWAPSVKAICHFPPVLGLMSERITETTTIGNAFLVQEEEVMEVIQELRVRAHTEGNLTTTFEQRVIVEKETIIIEPADPQVIYVPYYDPSSIYGTWWYPGHPPYYWAPGSISIKRKIAYWPRFYSGFTFGTWSFFDWRRHRIFIDAHKRPRFVRGDRWLAKPGPWIHVPRHRRGVAYRDKHTARKFGQSPYPSRESRRETRGYPERPGTDSFNSRDRFQPLSDQRSRFQMPDRKMPWEDSSDADRDRMEKTRREQERRKMEQSRRERQMRDQADRDRRQRARVEQENRQREQIRREMEQREHDEKEKRVRSGIQRDHQAGRRLDRERQARQRAERERRDRTRDNVFNRTDDGVRERRSSERGRASRQGTARESSGRGGIRREKGSGNDRGFKLQ